ncbi:MAG: hypothetical protein M1115_10760 [Actinobacteria bacterium]|nr:hypothetical protein [Actinomycetota bacterium]
MSRVLSSKVALGGWIISSLALAAVVVLAWASPAWAGTTTPVLRLAAEVAPHDPGAVELLATLEQPREPVSSGRVSLGGVSVSFSVRVEEFSGAPLLALGTAKTDAAGIAMLTYRPTWTGRQAFVATATNEAGTSLGSATTTFIAKSSPQSFAGTVEAVRPDGAIGQAVAGVLLSIVALIWIVLLAVVVRVNLGLGPSRAAESSGLKS